MPVCDPWQQIPLHRYRFDIDPTRKCRIGIRCTLVREYLLPGVILNYLSYILVPLCRFCFPLCWSCLPLGYSKYTQRVYANGIRIAKLPLKLGYDSYPCLKSYKTQFELKSWKMMRFPRNADCRRTKYGYKHKAVTLFCKRASFLCSTTLSIILWWCP